MKFFEPACYKLIWRVQDDTMDRSGYQWNSAEYEAINVFYRGLAAAAWDRHYKGKPYARQTHAISKGKYA